MRPARCVIGWMLVAGLGGLWLAGCASGGGGWTVSPQPAGEEEIWAIRCVTLQGPQQMERAERYADAIRQVPNLDPKLVRVLADDDGTAVYYGRYRRVYDSETGNPRYEPDPGRDLEMIRALRFEGSDVWPFILASMDLLPTYQPTHPEWNLARQAGFWTLQVGVFYNTGTFRSRRSAAEKYCAELRAQGEEAYYHHGPAQSSVTIGLFPRGAIARVQQEHPLSGKVTLTTEVVEPRIIELQKEYPFNLHNGHKMYDIVHDPRTGEVKERVPLPSFPVMLPGVSQRGLEGG